MSNTSKSAIMLSGPLSSCTHGGCVVRGIKVMDIIVVMIKSAPNDIRVLLFDVGGVLVQLGGVEAMLEWLGHRISVDELWRRWLQSVPVRRFETGQIDADEFAIGVTSEFGLAVEPRQFLESFTHWPTGLYPGTLEMLARIPRSYQRAVLSNSNALHWPRVQNEMKLGANDLEFKELLKRSGCWSNSRSFSRPKIKLHGEPPSPLSALARPIKRPADREPAAHSSGAPSLKH